MALPLFSFDTSKNETPETLKQRRAIALQLARGGGTPKTIGEGLTSLGDAILYRSLMSNADAAEREGRSSATSAIAEALSGIGGTIGGQPVAAPAPAPADMSFGGDQLMPPGASVELTPPQPAAGNAPVISDDIRAGIENTANALGIRPADLATAISYETGGTFDPVKSGPTTKWGQHRGLIQFGEPQAKQFGVDWNNPVASQLGPEGAIAKYLLNAGVKPGHGLMDIYSAINAGGVGRYNRSDAAAGGAPGTVADKVNNQMGSHRRIALAMFPELAGAAATMPETQASPVQVASLDPAAGMAPTAQPSPQDNVTRIAQAMTAPAHRLNVPGQPMPVTPQVRPQAGPDVQKLIEAGRNPWLNDAERAIVNTLLKNQLEQMDPTKALQRQKLEGEIRLQNNPRPPASIQEFEYGQNNPAFRQHQMDMKKAGAQNITVGGGRFGTIPPGYELIEGPNGAQMRPIPGGPAANEAAADQAKADQLKKQRATYADVVTTDIDRALTMIDDGNLPTTGLVGQALSNVPGTTAHDISRLIQTVKANVGFDRLQEMRANSPTGGALGQVSNFENELLQSTIGNLAQSQTKDQLVKNLRRVRNIYTRIVNEGIADPGMDESDEIKTDIPGVKIRRLD